MSTLFSPVVYLVSEAITV